MKVFYIDPQSYNNLSMYDYALLSHVAGHDVTYYHSDLYQLEQKPGNRQKGYFHYSSRKTPVAKALSYAWSILRLWIDVIVERPDIIHVQWIRFWIVDYLFARLAGKMGARLIFTAHNVLPHEQKSSDEKHFRKYYQLVDRIIVHSGKTRQELVGLFGLPEEKIRVIHHGVFEPAITREQAERRCRELRQELGIKEGLVVFSCLGVQKGYKGTDAVIRAWLDNAELRDNPQVRLLIIGRNHGLDFSRISQCGNAYVLDDMIPDLDFEAYLLLTSVLLLPYKRISQSGLLFSAVNRQCPCLVTDVGGLEEPFEYGRIGWKIGPFDESVLAREMKRLANAPHEIDRIREDAGAFEAVRKAYSWNTIGQQTSDLYFLV